MIRRFLLCPFPIGALFTAAWLVSRVYHFGAIGRALWYVAGPPVVVSLRFSSTIVFFVLAVCWAAFLFCPYWASFRLGRLSARATQVIVLLVAAVLTVACIAVALAGFPSQS